MVASTQIALMLRAPESRTLDFSSVRTIIAGGGASSPSLVAGAPDEVLGERGVAVVVPADPARPPTLDDLTGHLRGRIATHKLPEALRVVETLPLTPMQKVDRRALAAACVAQPQPSFE